MSKPWSIPFLLSAAAAADGDFDFLGGAVELAARLDDGDDLAGLGHFKPARDRRHGAVRDLVGAGEHVRIFQHQMVPAFAIMSMYWISPILI